MENLRDFLRISEAAENLGVSPNTLRNWANAGKIAAHRHPVNLQAGRTGRLSQAVAGASASTQEELSER